jgi:formate hydrogenlyase subunit 4
VLAIAGRSLQIGQMVGPTLYGAWGAVGPAMILVVVALLIVLLTETCRVPVDDPATHLELTMIHEVMVLDHSGPDFAAITYAAALKFMLLGAILLHAALPHAGLAVWADAPLRAAELVFLAALVGVFESIMARLRLNRVPLLLAAATVLAMLATVFTLTRSAA